jgi:hypothetical protein
MTNDTLRKIENLIQDGAWLKSPYAILSSDFGGWLVTEDGEEVYSGPDLDKALDAFEKATLDD